MVRHSWKCDSSPGAAGDVSPTPRRLHSQGHIEIPSVVFLTTPFLFVSGRKRLLTSFPEPVSRTSSCGLLRPLDPSRRQEGGSFQAEEIERVKPARGTQTSVQCGQNRGHVKPGFCPERWVKVRGAEPGTASGSDCTWHPWEQGALGRAEGPGQGRAQALSPAARADGKFRGRGSRATKRLLIVEAMETGPGW